jgi:hypothetical protein
MGTIPLADAPFMPKRTNQFQRIVAYLYSQFEGKDDVRVRASVLLEEQGTGNRREVDVLVELSKGNDAENTIPVRNWQLVTCKGKRHDVESITFQLHVPFTVEWAPAKRSTIRNAGVTNWQLTATDGVVTIDAVQIEGSDDLRVFVDKPNKKRRRTKSK